MYIKNSISIFILTHKMENNKANKYSKLKLEKKRELIIFKRNNTDCSQRFLASRCNTSIGTVNQILKNDEAILSENYKKYKVYLRKTKLIDSILLQWFSSKRERNFPVSIMDLKTAALRIP